MAARRLTSTFRRDMRIAPRDSVTDTTIGSSSGASPTASAMANKNESSQGRPRHAFTSSTNRTMNSASRRIRSPNARVPCSNAEGGGWRWREAPIWPRHVFAPVSMTTARAVPLTTDVPISTASSCSAS